MKIHVLRIHRFTAMDIFMQMYLKNLENLILITGHFSRLETSLSVNKILVIITDHLSNLEAILTSVRSYSE